MPALWRSNPLERRPLGVQADNTTRCWASRLIGAALGRAGPAPSRVPGYAERRHRTGEGLIIRAKMGAAMLVVAGALALAGCGGSSPTSEGSSGRSAVTTSVEGTSWLLASYDNDGTAVPAPKAAAAALAFAADGRLQGSTGCNAFAGTYTSKGSQLSLHLGPMTLMACTDPATNRRSRPSLATLPEIASFRDRAGQLELLGSAGTALLTYRAGLAGLSGTAWVVTGVNTGTAVEGTALTEQLTATFGGDGQFTGFGGCNTLSGPYATSGADGLTIGPLQLDEGGLQ